MTEEQVVLLDARGRPCGAMPKAAVHHRDTPLHLAFSCWVRDERHRWLLTRRAADKLTWPLVWTNAVCGHPAPGEDLVDAVRRRAATELGLLLDVVHPLLPDFGYRAVMANGIVENEVCPVYVSTVAAGVALHPDPAEVDDLRWVSGAELRAGAAAEPHRYSPWLLAQLTEVSEEVTG